MSTPKPDEQRRAEMIAQPAAFPHELARCTCGTRSFERDDHANTCALGPNPPLSSDPTDSPFLEAPELRF
ncbi:hypothetical protein AU191_16815 [Mycolicibacterium acapulense]|nr:hypothetical protein AU191_16815 [Mycolicibacterium acapulense]